MASDLQLKGSMQQGLNFIFLKIYLHEEFAYNYHVKKQIVINNIIN